jgi:hypothetical protein
MTILDVPELPLTLDRRFLSSLSQDRDVSGNSRFLGSLAPTSGLWAAEPKLARFGPTTPTRARRPSDASVDDTDARSGSRLDGRMNRKRLRKYLAFLDRPSRRAHTRANQNGPVNAFHSVDHNTPADLESCHATIADLSPRCIAA